VPKGKGPGKGRSPAAARAPRSGPGGIVLLHLCGTSGGIKRPGNLARQPSRVRSSYGGAGSLFTPSWTHEDTSVHARGRDRSPEERRARHFNSGGDEASFTSGTWMFQRPSSSHTPTPVGSLVKGGDYRRGEADS
ncbi:hypothetical protein M9458_043317, partial [Cirrhinus mrigala]